MMKQDCQKEHRELTESTEESIGIWSQSEFRLSDLIQALCELTDPRRISQREKFVTESTEESQRTQNDASNSAPVQNPSQ
jgi:hypothetical protein